MAATLRQRLEYWGFRWAVCLIECLPVRLAARLADGFAGLVLVLPRRWTRYQVAADNLRRAFGSEFDDRQIERTVQEMWAHLFRTVCEIVQSRRKLHLESYRRVVQFVGLNLTNESLLSGRRVLMLGGHFGNWEVSTALCGIWGFRMGVVAREMDNPLLNDWFRRDRERTGHRLLLKKGGFDDMTSLLQQGGIVGLLGDQDAGPRGLFVPFFGHPASTFKSIALLSLEYDAPILVGAAIRRHDDFVQAHWSQFEVRCEELIDPRETTSNDPVGEITRRYTAALERAIRQAPEQYFWLHRRWKSEPRAQRRAAA